MQATTSDVREALARVELLSSLELPILDRLTAGVRDRSWQPGELIVQQGAPGESLIVLLEGAATVYRETSDGSRAALAHLQAPTTLGEVTLFDGAPRTASVEAVQRCSGLELLREDLLALVQGDPEFLDALLQSLGRLVRRLSEQAADQLLLDLPGRIAKALVALTPSPPAPPVVTLSQARIAELAGGSRQSLNQVLRRFAERGLLRVDAAGINVLDVAALRRRAGLPELG